MKDKNGNEDTIHIPCVICGERPASVMKGGIYNDIRDMWFVCKECKPKISDNRMIERRTDDRRE